MKQGTIQIDCGEKTCDGCSNLVIGNQHNYTYCTLFKDCDIGSKFNYSSIVYYRCQQCLDTFNEIKDEDN